MLEIKKAMFGGFTSIYVYRQPPFSRMGGISGLRIHAQIHKTIPDKHHHHIFVIDVTISVLVRVDNVLGAIVIAQYIVVDWQPFLIFKGKYAECEREKSM